MHSDEYYNSPYLFQMIEKNLPVGCESSQKELELMKARVVAEVREVDRRLKESEVYEKYYSAKFEPAQGATCFSLTYQYRMVDIGQAKNVATISKGGIYKGIYTSLEG